MPLTRLLQRIASQPVRQRRSSHRVRNHGRVGEPCDEVQQRLVDLQGRLREIADVERDEFAVGLCSVHVTPRRPGGLAFSWIELGDEVIFEAGHLGGRWELPRSVGSVAFMEQLVDAVLRGRVKETFGPRRSRVEITTEGGLTFTETGHTSLWPAPGWRRRGRTVEYRSYFG